MCGKLELCLQHVVKRQGRMGRSSSSSSSTSGLKCVRPQTATILTRHKWKLLPFPFCGDVARGSECGCGFRYGFWICYCCWLRFEPYLYRISCEVLGKTSQLLCKKICSQSAQENFSSNKCSVEQRKNADHLFWPPMNLIDNFCSAPVTQPILHLSGWENIWIYACA